MSKLFVEDLDVAELDRNFEVDSTLPAVQAVEIMKKLEKVVLEEFQKNGMEKPRKG